jgi:hypothetical protein
MTTEAFFERANELIDSVVDYETSHVDAGNNYAHMASEGDFDYHNGENLLVDYCKEMGIDLEGVDLDRLAEDVIFWSYMVQGQAFDPRKRFLVASYPVGEIETQVESSVLGVKFTPYLINKLNRETWGYWRYDDPKTAYVYSTTDSYWDQVCNSDVIQDLVNQQKES